MDLTSWWPRPKAESIVDELARLQAADGVAPVPTRVGPRGSVLPKGVRPGGAFPKARSGGYEISDVDTFLATAGLLSAADVRGTAFRTARSGGYDRDAVDTALARLAGEAEAREAAAREA